MMKKKTTRILNEGENASAKGNKSITRPEDTWYEKWWIKYLTLPLIVLLVGAYIVFKFGLNGNAGIPDKTPSDQKYITTQQLTIPNNQQSNSTLRALEPLETNKDISKLSNDIYGYAYNFQIARFVKKTISELTLTNQLNKYKFEVQKSNNLIFVMGFVDETTFSKIGEASVDNPLSIVLFPINWRGDKHLVSVPIESLINTIDRNIDIGKSEEMGILEGAILSADLGNDIEIYRNDSN